MEIKYNAIENYTHQRTANLINNTQTSLYPVAMPKEIS